MIALLHRQGGKQTHARDRGVESTNRDYRRTGRAQITLILYAGRARVAPGRSYEYITRSQAMCVYVCTGPLNEPIFTPRSAHRGVRNSTATPALQLAARSSPRMRNPPASPATNLRNSYQARGFSNLLAANTRDERKICYLNQNCQFRYDSIYQTLQILWYLLFFVENIIVNFRHFRMF